jgi:hypothetical protein
VRARPVRKMSPSQLLLTGFAKELLLPCLRSLSSFLLPLSTCYCCRRHVDFAGISRTCCCFSRPSQLLPLDRLSDHRRRPHQLCRSRTLGETMASFFARC